MKITSFMTVNMLPYATKNVQTKTTKVAKVAAVGSKAIRGPSARALLATNAAQQLKTIGEKQHAQVRQFKI